jgi:hypothetical protein
MSNAISELKSVQMMIPMALSIRFRSSLFHAIRRSQHERCSRENAGNQERGALHCLSLQYGMIMPSS